MGALGVVLLLLGIPALGRLAQRAVGLRSPSRTLQWGLATAMGFALTMFALYLPLALGAGVMFMPVLGLLALAVLWALQACWRERWLRWADRKPALVGLVILALIASIAHRFPYWGYDAKAIYGFKAKVLLHERDVTGAPFQDVDVIHYHVDYPLGVPLLIALSAFAAEGNVADPSGAAGAPNAIEWVERYDAIEAYGVVGVLWVLGILALLLEAARSRTPRPSWAATWALVFCGIPLALALPWIAGRSWSWEGADLPLALCLGAAGLAALRSIEGEKGHLQAAFLCGGGALMLKNDALLGIASLMLALLLSVSPRRSLRPVLTLGCAALLFTLLVSAVKSQTAGSPFDEHYSLRSASLAAMVARVPELLNATWDVFVSKSMLAYWLFVLLVGVPFGWAAGGPRRLLALWLSIHLLVCMGVFLLSPNELTWHVQTALPRLWAQMGVPAGVLAISALVRLWRLAPDQGALPRPLRAR